MTGDLAHLSDKPRSRTDWSAFAGLSLTRDDTGARSASGPVVTDTGVEERALAKFDHDAKRLRKEMRGRVGKGER